MVSIQVGLGQPFESRRADPNDLAVCLSFHYDAETVTAVKGAIRAVREKLDEVARATLNKGNANAVLSLDARIPKLSIGGWAPESRVWYVEKPYWPMVRHHLRKHKIALVGSPELLTEDLADQELKALLFAATENGMLSQVSALVLADWLYEHDDARASAVRECAMARWAAANIMGLFDG